MEYDPGNDKYQSGSISYSASDSTTVKYKQSHSCGRCCNPCINCRNI